MYSTKNRRTFILFTVIGLFLAVHAANAQAPIKFKYRNNPAYSVHNYKQPDKAALAKKYNIDGPATFEYTEPVFENGSQTKRSYKDQTRGESVNTGAVIPTAPKVPGRKQPSANYKQQAG